jgi:type I restriction enzyme S subunit
LQEQQAVAERLDTVTSEINTTISRLEREITLLREYRTRLVADVVTGKLDVRSVKFEGGSVKEEGEKDGYDDDGEEGGGEYE